MQTLISRDGKLCCWCGDVLEYGTDKFPTVEHVVRRAEGGTDDLSNLKISCFKCNTTRHNTNESITPIAFPMIPWPKATVTTREGKAETGDVAYIGDSRVTVRLRRNPLSVPTHHGMKELDYVYQDIDMKYVEISN